MGGGAVEGHLGADADSYDHEAELVVHAVGEHPTEIVDDHREEDRKGGHRGADPDQHLDPGKASCQGVHGHLRGEGAQKHSPRHGGLRIGVLEPVVEQRKRTLDTEGDENKPTTQAVEPHIVECQRARLVDVCHGPCKQQHAGGYLEDQVPHAGPIRSLAAARPDQEYGGDRGELPVNEKRDQVTGENRADGAAGVDESGDVLSGVLHAEGEDHADERRDVEDVAEHEAERIDADGRQGVVEDGDLQEITLRNNQQLQEAQCRQKKHVGRARAPAQQRDQQPPEDQERAGRKAIDHSSRRPGPRSCAAAWQQEPGAHRRRSHRSRRTR